MTNAPFQHQFFIFGEVATITRHASGLIELHLARWVDTSETTLDDARGVFGLCPLVHCPHLTLGDVLPISEA